MIPTSVKVILSHTVHGVKKKHNFSEAHFIIYTAISNIWPSYLWLSVKEK